MSISEENKAEPCDDCGEVGRMKARASRTHQQLYGAKFTETKLFCHDEEKSCYNYRRGRYFEGD